MAELKLIDRPFLECQSTSKGIHLCKCMLIHRMHLLLSFDGFLYVYSLKSMLMGYPALSVVLPLSKIFQSIPTQEYMDEIAAVFGKKGEEFGKAIFIGEGGKNNLLLKCDKVKERIRFLGSQEIIVKKIESAGEGLLIVLCDGRACYVSDLFSSNPNTISLTSLHSSKIIAATMLSQSLVLLVIHDKIAIHSLIDHSFKPIVHKWNQSWRVADVHGEQEGEKEKWTVVFVGADRIIKLEITRKKIIVIDQYKSEQFISKSFFHKRKFFVNTAQYILEHDLKQISKPKLIFESVHPISVLHVDSFGNFVLQSQNSLTQRLHLIAQSPAGVYFAVTSGRNGNYKEGRIGVFETGWEGIIRAVSNQIIDEKVILTEEIGLLTEWKGRKQKLQQLSLIPKSLKSSQEKVQIEGITLKSSQLDILLLHLLRPFLPNTHHSLTKIIERLASHPRNVCMFSGQSIGEQEVVECKNCCLYGLEEKGDRCAACRGPIFKV